MTASRIAGLLFASIAALGLASCSQEVKITAPRYALLFGIGAYAQGNDLGGVPQADADAMKTLLSSEGWSVSENNDANATKAKIFEDIDLLAATVSPEATVLLYYSGHGDSEGSTQYIIPIDAIPTSGNISISGFISTEELAQALAKLPTRNVIVILDSCYSGGFVAQESSIDAAPQKAADLYGGAVPSALNTAVQNFGDLLYMNSRAVGKSPIVISAAGSAEKSWQDSDYQGYTSIYNHGIFTYYLLESARLGDSNGDGLVTTTEAYTYAASMINANWNSSGSKDPFYPHISGGVRDLVLFTK
jgi:hypothetical protein